MPSDAMIWSSSSRMLSRFIGISVVESECVQGAVNNQICSTRTLDPSRERLRPRLRCVGQMAISAPEGDANVRILVGPV